MARYPYTNWAVDQAGNVLNGAAFEVRTSAGVLVPTIYAAETGGTTVANPGTADSSGKITFWIDDGIYDITIGSGASEVTERFSTVAQMRAQSSATDVTAERLLKVGAFGMGTTSAATTPVGDLATTVTTGFYAYEGIDADRPNAGGQGGSFIVSRHSDNWLRQIAFLATGVNIWHRWSTDNGTTWSDWSEIYHQNSILGTVSESSGVPTGAIIERGSNTNGDYVRFADGTQLCWHIGTSGTAWSMPASFAGTAGDRVVTGSGTGSASITITLSNNLTNSATPRAFNGPGVEQTGVTVYLFAMGRWF